MKKSYLEKYEDKEILEALGVTLTQLRVKHGLEQKEVAADVGVSLHAIVDWEKGHRSITISNFIKLMCYYGKTESIEEIIPKENFSIDRGTLLTRSKK